MSDWNPGLTIPTNPIVGMGCFNHQTYSISREGYGSLVYISVYHYSDQWFVGSFCCFCFNYPKNWLSDELTSSTNLEPKSPLFSKFQPKRGAPFGFQELFNLFGWVNLIPLVQNWGR